MIDYDDKTALGAKLHKRAEAILAAEGKRGGSYTADEYLAACARAQNEAPLSEEDVDRLADAFTPEFGTIR